MNTIKSIILSKSFLQRFLVTCIFLICVNLISINPAEADAVQIRPGEPVTGNLPTHSTINNYEFTLTSDGYITVDFEHEPLTGTNLGWRITLYDDEGRWLDEFTSRLNQEKTNSASIGLAAGRYYVRVDVRLSLGSPASGWTHSNVDYTMTLNYTVSDYWEKEPNNNFDTATAIDVNMAYMGSLNWSGDVDYFIFQLHSDGYISIDFEHERLTGTNLGWRITLYNDEGKWLAEFTSRLNQEKTNSASIGLAAGRYYVRVDVRLSLGSPASGWTHSNVDYTMTLNYTVSDYWEKEPNNNFDTATAIDVNMAYMGSLNWSGDVDYFEFSLISEDTITIDFEHERLTGTNLGWRITLYDGEGKWLAEFTSRLNQEKTNSASIGLAAGIYYVRVDVRLSLGSPASGWTHSNVDYKLTVKAPSVVSVDNSNNEIMNPQSFNLLQNYPNPFNPTTIIEYELKQESDVILSVYNALGQRVATLVHESQTSGRYKVNYDSKDLPSGVYIYRLQAGEYVESRKMLYIR